MAPQTRGIDKVTSSLRVAWRLRYCRSLYTAGHHPCRFRKRNKKLCLTVPELATALERNFPQCKSELPPPFPNREDTVPSPAVHCEWLGSASKKQTYCQLTPSTSGFANLTDLGAALIDVAVVPLAADAQICAHPPTPEDPGITSQNPWLAKPGFPFLIPGFSW